MSTSLSTNSAIAAGTSPTHVLKPLATLNPPSSSRTWQTVPHPRLPIAATACSDKTVRVYSLTSFTLLSTIGGGHKRSIRACAWKPNIKGESVLATGSFDASAGIWRKWDDDGGGGGAVGMKDADEVDFTQGEENEEEDADDDDWRFTTILDGHESEIKSLAWSAGGQFLATCSRDKSVWVWEELEDDNFETVAVLQEHDADVKCVAWHPEEDLLASGSYDDAVRLYREDMDDWACVSLLNGHDGTVWWVDWEPVDNPSFSLDRQGQVDGLGEAQRMWLETRQKSGPRLISTSDDMTIRIWQRKSKPEASAPPTGQGRMPSILQSNSIEEEWVETVRLPQRHTRSIYCAAWSKKSGLVVSTGSDGLIVVYEERWNAPSAPSETEEPNGTARAENGLGEHTASKAETEWVVVTELEGAHGVYEVNHVAWAQRRDRSRRQEDEEVIISTGDDGEVKVWTLEKG